MVYKCRHCGGNMKLVHEHGNISSYNCANCAHMVIISGRIRQAKAGPVKKDRSIYRQREVMAVCKSCGSSNIVHTLHYDVCVPCAFANLIDTQIY